MSNKITSGFERWARVQPFGYGNPTIHNMQDRREMYTMFDARLNGLDLEDREDLVSYLGRVMNDALNDFEDELIDLENHVPERFEAGIFDLLDKAWGVFKTEMDDCINESWTSFERKLAPDVRRLRQLMDDSQDMIARVKYDVVVFTRDPGAWQRPANQTLGYGHLGNRILSIRPRRPYVERAPSPPNIDRRGAPLPPDVRDDSSAGKDSETVSETSTEISRKNCCRGEGQDSGFGSPCEAPSVHDDSEIDENLNNSRQGETQDDKASIEQRLRNGDTAGAEKTV